MFCYWNALTGARSYEAIDFYSSATNAEATASHPIVSELHVKSTLNYFVERGSNIRHEEAFDSVNHFKMSSTLLDAGIPLPVVNVMCNLSKLFAAVRWNSCLSLPFSVVSGVRRGRSLSLALFNLYIIVSIKSFECGCYISGRFLVASCMPTILLF